MGVAAAKDVFTSTSTTDHPTYVPAHNIRVFPSSIILLNQYRTAGSHTRVEQPKSVLSERVNPSGKRAEPLEPNPFLCRAVQGTSNDHAGAGM